MRALANRRLNSHTIYLNTLGCMLNSFQLDGQLTILRHSFISTLTRMNHYTHASRGGLFSNLGKGTVFMV